MKYVSDLQHEEMFKLNSTEWLHKALEFRGGGIKVNRWQVIDLRWKRESEWKWDEEEYGDEEWLILLLSKVSGDTEQLLQMNESSCLFQ